MRTFLLSLALLLIAQSSVGAEDSKYFVFIGEKVSVTAVPPPEGSRDLKFLAKYRVLEPFKGTYNGTDIEFTVFDHYGPPSFSTFRYALLYVVRLGDGYLHEKYAFSPLFKTKDGRWAGPYDVGDYDHKNNKRTSIKPVIIDFEEPVTFDIPSGAKESDIKAWFPKPYYRIENGKAIAVYGNYLPDLFLLKKNGFLKARGTFQ